MDPAFSLDDEALADNVTDAYVNEDPPYISGDNPGWDIERLFDSFEHCVTVSPRFRGHRILIRPVVYSHGSGDADGIMVCIERAKPGLHGLVYDWYDVVPGPWAGVDLSFEQVRTLMRWIIEEANLIIDKEYGT